MHLDCMLPHKQETLPSHCQWNSIFEIFGEHPSYHELKTFDCLCYSKVNSPNTKFQPKVVQGIFLGYSTQIKRYKILNIETNEISWIEMWSFMNRSSHSKTLLTQTSTNYSLMNHHQTFPITTQAHRLGVNHPPHRILLPSLLKHHLHPPMSTPPHQLLHLTHFSQSKLHLHHLQLLVHPLILMTPPQFTHLNQL